MLVLMWVSAAALSSGLCMPAVVPCTSQSDGNLCTLSLVDTSCSFFLDMSCNEITLMSDKGCSWKYGADDNRAIPFDSSFTSVVLDDRFLNATLTDLKSRACNSFTVVCVDKEEVYIKLHEVVFFLNGFGGACPSPTTTISISSNTSVTMGSSMPSSTLLISTAVGSSSSSVPPTPTPGGGSVGGTSGTQVAFILTAVVFSIILVSFLIVVGYITYKKRCQQELVDGNDGTELIYSTLIMAVITFIFAVSCQRRRKAILVFGTVSVGIDADAVRAPWNSMQGQRGAADFCILCKRIEGGSAEDEVLDSLSNNGEDFALTPEEEKNTGGNKDNVVNIQERTLRKHEKQQVKRAHQPMKESSDTATLPLGCSSVMPIVGNAETSHSEEDQFI